MWRKKLARKIIKRLESTKSNKSETEKRQRNTKTRNATSRIDEKDSLTIKLNLDYPEQATSYATVDKTEQNDREVDPKEQVRILIKQGSPRDPIKILKITGKQNFGDCVESKKTFGKTFPLKKLVYDFTTARGNTHLEFLTVEEADIVVKYWNPELFGGDSVARKVNDKRNEHSALSL